jgi:hypothetical protein
MNENKVQRIKDLEELIQELKSQLPAHSVKPEMLIRIEELEDELEKLKSELK